MGGGLYMHASLLALSTILTGSCPHKRVDIFVALRQCLIPGRGIAPTVCIVIAATEIDPSYTL